jgi:transcription initiation factor IIE alpha subunit
MRVINVGTEGNKKFTLNSMSAPKDYNLSRSQFAKELGITRENLKQRMRRGQYKDHYILENGRYKFTLDEAACV